MALRVSALEFTFHLGTGDASITHEVTGYLRGHQRGPIRSANLGGRSHSYWQVDFPVHTSARRSRVYVLHPGNRAGASRVIAYVVSV